MDKLKTKYTFWKLINQYTIEIPIMQRDYAQGRIDERTNAIREGLLDSLFRSIDGEGNIDFDFIYGTVKESKLYPLDGQQRLTTLFLLYWYIAIKEGRLTSEITRVLDKFTYSTRISSREFCHALAKFNIDLYSNTNVSEVIKDSNWYFRSWDKDPTIKAMLVTIDDIHDKFFYTDDVFDKLIRDIDENPPITFSFIALDDYSLTDNLYIKMNARGKTLSDFENFKAKFMQHLKNKGFEYKRFEDSIDNNWTDLLWEYRSSNDNTIDDAFMRLFVFITEMIYAEDAEAKDINSPYRTSNINIATLINTYDTNEKVLLLYEMLDLWSNKEEIFECMNSIFCREYKNGKTRLFGSNMNLMDQCLKGENLSFPNKVLLYMIMRRMVYYKSQNKKDTGLNDYARVIRNLVSRIRTLYRYSFQSDFRYGRHAIPFVQFIKENFLDIDNVYEILPSLKAPAAIREESLQDEKDKADLINKDASYKTTIHHLEDSDLFEGSIHNVIGLLDNSYKDYTNIFEEIFAAQNTNTATRALLSIADYGIRIGGSALGHRIYYGTKGNWNTILTYKKDDNYPKTFHSLITQYNNAKSSNVQSKLEEIIENNSKNLDRTMWRYYFVNYPRMINNKDMLYAFEIRHENNLKIHSMGGITLNAYHIVPLYREIALQLGDEICNYNYCYGINSDEGAIVLNCGVSVNQKEDGSFIITYRDDEQKEPVNDAIEKFNSINKDDLDYVEEGVILCNMLHEALNKDKILNYAD